MMTKVKLRYVQAWVDRHGKAYVYFRRPGYELVRLPPIGSPGFMSAYETAMAMHPQAIGERASVPGSVSAAIAAYYLSGAWAAFAAGTQAKHRQVLEKLRARYGTLPLAQMHEAFVIAYMAKLRPHARVNTFKALRGWLRHVQHDVTKAIDTPTAKSTKHHSWLPEEIAAYERHHAIGTKARLAFALARFTGAGRAEIASMGPANIKGGVITIVRQKTGVEATIPVHPELARVLEATPVTGLATFLVTARGRPYNATALSNQFRDWCDQVNLPARCHLHGLRHAMGDALAGAGSTIFEIAAVLGHASPRTTAHYTQGADRKRMAGKAIKRLIGGTADEP
jgi:integrase